MKRHLPILIGGSTLLVVSPAIAQPIQGMQPEAATTAPAADPQALPEDQAERANRGQDAASAGEIVVTARRRDELLQDVPISLNVVNNQTIQELNIRRFEELSSVIPGLNLQSNANGIGAIASVRGVNYDVNASGNNGTIEFYQNDAPISAGNLFQALFDVGQVELLRGPQGTLRGRASPSGSMTVTTRSPDLDEMGGYVSMTGNLNGGVNAQGAVGLPIVPGVLALRIAGAVEENEGSRVTSFNNPGEPFSRTWGGRISLRFDPTDFVTVNASYQRIEQRVRAFNQVESDTCVPTLPCIEAEDRRAVEDAPRLFKQTFDNANLRAQLSFAGQRLNYVGAYNRQRFSSFDPPDRGNFFSETAPGPFGSPALRGYGQQTETLSKAWAHELRLSSEERLFGMLDYIVGVFRQKTDVPTFLTSPTVLTNPLGFPIPIGPGGTAPFVPARGALVLQTPIDRVGGTKETSFFGNLTLHLGERTEISGGVRHIKYKDDGRLIVAGVPTFASTADESATIYLASVKHEFSDDLMVYASTGSSWRPPVIAIGDFSVLPSPLERSFIELEAETSKSYEAGVKATAMNKRLRANFSVFYQKFKNFPYRSASGVFFLECTAATAGVCTANRVNNFNFVAAVPVTVKGFEFDGGIQVMRDWDIGVTVSYARSKIKNGLVPCNPPTASGPGGVPTPADFPPGTTIFGCPAGFRATIQPLWGASVQSEYKRPISPDVDGFVRGLLTWQGNSQNDPQNPRDDVESYFLLNLYAGIRAPDGAWEVSLYGKNIAKTERVLSRSITPLTTPYRDILFGPQTGITTYNGITFTQPREFGVTARFAFGSR